MTIVYHRHLGALGYCNRGSRQFFKRHNLSWADFLANGIPADDLLATNDAMAENVVRVAESEQAQDGQ
jgi:hypothetical protein